MKCTVAATRPLTDVWTSWRIELRVVQNDGVSAITSTTAKFRDLLIASLGDSAASGEGNPEKPVGPSVGGCFPPASICGHPWNATWAPNGGARCDRSGRAATAQWAYRLQNAEQSVTFWHLACSGATIESPTSTTSLAFPVNQPCLKPGCTFTIQFKPAIETNYTAGTTALVWNHTGIWPVTLATPLGAGATAAAVTVPDTSYGLKVPAGTEFAVGSGWGGVLTPYDGANPPCTLLGFDQCIATPQCPPGVRTGTDKCHAPLPPQLDQLEGLVSQAGRPLDALLMEIGANDVDWVPLVKDCYASGLLSHPHSTCVNKEGPGVVTRLEANAQGTTGFLPDRFADLNAKLIQYGIVEPDRVFLEEYWDATQDYAGGGQSPHCPNEFPNIVAYPPARQWGHVNVIVPMNKLLSQQPGRFGWNWVGGIAKAFYGHGICSKDAWIESVLHSTDHGGEGSIDGSWHASRTGQAKISDMLDGAVDQVFDKPAPSPTSMMSIHITSPTSGTTVTAGQPVQLSATFTRFAGNYIQLIWNDSVQGKIGQGINATAVLHGAGSHTISAVLIDLALPGHPTVTDTVQVTVVVPTYTLAVTVNTGPGSVKSTDGGINCTSQEGETVTCAAKYDAGTSVTLTETPGYLADFGVWQGACSGVASSCTVNMTGDENVTAVFEKFS
jgi:hypothetical protein